MKLKNISKEQMLADKLEERRTLKAWNKMVRMCKNKDAWIDETNFLTIKTKHHEENA